MAKEYINIHFGKVDLDVRAYLLTDFNPEVCQAFKNTLPNRSVMSHAVVAGEQMYWPYRLVVDRACCNTEDMAKQPPGRINIELDFQYLSVNYGEITEGVPSVALAQVVEEDLTKLPVVGRRAWDNLIFEKDYMLVDITYLGGEA